MAKKKTSKDELVEKLKDLDGCFTKLPDDMNAMCYYRVFTPKEERTGKCSSCGSDIILLGDDYLSINEIVLQIKSLGYDVKVDMICHVCSEKLKKELYPDSKPQGEECFYWNKDILIGSVNFVFYFRLNPDAEYHRAIANDINKYEALYALLQKKPIHGDSCDASQYTTDEIATLEFMTGIKCTDSSTKRH